MQGSSKSKRPLKIGFVFDDSLDKPDGVQQYITTLGRWLMTQGHEVHYLVGQTRSSHGDHTHSLARNIKVSFNKNRLSVPLPAKRRVIRQVLADEKFDVLHIQLPCSPLFGGRVVQLADPATVIVGTFHIVGHTWVERHSARALSLLQRSTMQRINHFVSVSTAAADFARLNFGIKDSLVLPNVIELDRFTTGTPIKHLMDDKLNIVFLGRLVARKGCQYLLEAIARLRDRGAADNVRVLICGSGPLELRLKAKMRSKRLSDILKFVGFIDEADKADYLASAHIAVFPSTGGESFGIVLIEAMAAGAGVVMGGDNVGYRTVLGEHANHLLFDPYDTRTLADKIQLLLTNPALCKKLHAWQQQTVKQYDVSVVGTKLLKLYRQPNKQ